jgi:uncharacterized protein
MARALTVVAAAAWLAATGVTAVVSAQEMPALRAPVNDFAGLIDQSSRETLDRRIRALQTASGDVVVVATVKTFAPYGSIEEFALEMFERSGIGTRANDNGLLIVVAAEERRVRIEVGYGLEEFVTDGFAGEVIRRDMLPEFRSGRYGAGLVAGTTSVIQRIAERRGVPLTDMPQRPPPHEEPDGPPEWIFVVIIGLWILMNIIRRFTRPRSHRRRRRGPWSGWTGGVGGFGTGPFGGGFGGFGGGFGRGGGGGGGFGGFGGGRSGGGGASGGW